MARNPSLADVRARRAEIATEIAKLKPLQDEDQKLATVEAMLVSLFSVEEMAKSEFPSLAAALQAGLKTPPPPPPVEEESDDDDGESLILAVKRAMRGNESLEELIHLLMDECSDDWWTATEIQDVLTTIKGKKVLMSSVSPTLSMMKSKGTIVRNGHNVALATRVQTNEAAAE